MTAYKEQQRSATIRDRQRVNSRILRTREVRVIDENGAQVGIIASRDALTMAEERGLDLVEVAPNAVPPVCRIMDYGKFRYEQTKKEREARKNQKQVELKQIRLEPKTDSHDIEVKSKQARRFLIEGNKVKFNLRFRGREIFHQEIGRDILLRVRDMLQDISIVEQNPLMEGRVLSLMLAPNAKAKQLQVQHERDVARAQRKALAARTPKPAQPNAASDADDVEHLPDVGDLPDDDDVEDLLDVDDDDINDDDIDDEDDDDIDDLSDDEDDDDTKDDKE